MKGALLFVVAVAILTGYVTAKTKIGTRHNCILLTPEKEAQIEEVVERFTIFLNKLSQEMEDIDLKLINLEVDEHSDDEVEKDTVLQLTVNNCVRKAYEPNNKSEETTAKPENNETSTAASNNTESIENTTCKEEEETTTVEPQEEEENNDDITTTTQNTNTDKVEEENKQYPKGDSVNNEVKTESGSLSEYNQGPKINKTDTIDVHEADKSNLDCEKNAVPNIYFLNLPPEEQAFIDKLRRVKKNKNPLVAFVEDLNPIGEKDSKYVFDEASSTEYIESDNSEDAIGESNKKTKSGKPIAKILNLKLPRNGEFLLNEFSRKKGYPVVIYIDDIPELHRRRYVFVDK